jgi:hypothetical protein
MQSSLKRFAIGIPAAALAGGATAFLVAIVFVMFVGKLSEREIGNATQLASFVGFWALLISFAYTLVLGLAVYLYMRSGRAAPSFLVAIVIALLGSIPFILPVFKTSAVVTIELLLIPLLSVLCALVTATTFWRVALRP